MTHRLTILLLLCASLAQAQPIPMALPKTFPARTNFFTVYAQDGNAISLPSNELATTLRQMTLTWHASPSPGVTNYILCRSFVAGKYSSGLNVGTNLTATWPSPASPQTNIITITIVSGIESGPTLDTLITLQLFTNTITITNGGVSVLASRFFRGVLQPIQSQLLAAPQSDAGGSTIN